MLTPQIYLGLLPSLRVDRGRTENDEADKRVWAEQYIFSDHTYDKPFFVVYINTSMFAISLAPVLLQHARRHGVAHLQNSVRAIWDHRYRGHTRLKGEEDEPRTDRGVVDGSDETLALAAGVDDDDADDQRRHGVGGDGGVTERLLVDDEATLLEGHAGGDAALADLGNSALIESGEEGPAREEKLSLRETAWLSLEFCMLWFLANYLASACLGYTSVGSVTILTSTSSVWTLVFCALMRVEGFTVRKLVGVLASLAGIVLISSVDLSGKSDENRGNFPHKSQMQILIGDGMAFASAIIYGLYVTVMKLRVGNEDRVSMPLFFGLVGFFNVIFLWPGFILLHYTGIETVSTTLGGGLRTQT